MTAGTDLNIHTQTHQARSEYLHRGISVISLLPNDDFDPMWDYVIVAEDNKERLPSQAILNFALRPKVSRSGCVSQSLPHVGWLASVCGLPEVLHG